MLQHLLLDAIGTLGKCVTHGWKAPIKICPEQHHTFCLGVHQTLPTHYTVNKLNTKVLEKLGQHTHTKFINELSKLDWQMCVSSQA
jgi:hypothetical protein